MSHHELDLDPGVGRQLLAIRLEAGTLEDQQASTV